jgi:hypothetical protein
MILFWEQKYINKRDPQRDPLLTNYRTKTLVFKYLRKQGKLGLMERKFNRISPDSYREAENATAALIYIGAAVKN